MYHSLYPKHITFMKKHVCVCVTIDHEAADVITLCRCVYLYKPHDQYVGPHLIKLSEMWYPLIELKMAYITGFHYLLCST